MSGTSPNSAGSGDHQTDQSREGMWRSVEQAAQRLFVVLLVVILVVALGLRAVGREIVSATFDIRSADYLFLYSLIVVVIIVAGLLIRRSEIRQSSIVLASLGTALIAVVGLGLAPQQNAWEAFATRLPAERRIEERARLEPNGFMSAVWPFYTELGELAVDGVVVPAPGSGYFVTEISEVSVEQQQYDYVLAPDDPRMRGEWILDVPIDDESHLIVIGRSTRYRMFETATHTVFIAEPV